MTTPDPAERYQPGQRLGGGDGATTCLAVDQHSGQTVVLKTLSLKTLPNWEALQHFENEARILKQLTHPRVPRLLDSWQTDTGHGPEATLVLEYIPGQSLAQKLDAGWRADEAEVKGLLRQALLILVDLHALQPPLLHRDLKPSNLMLDPQDRLFVIDFGGIQAALHPAGERTVVGTFGYLPPEQLRGQALPASDLYSLGVTAVELLHGGPVAWMLDTRMQLRFRPHLQISARFANWLSRLLEPELRLRFRSAAAALKALDTLDTPARQRLPLRHMRPPGARSQIQRFAQELQIHFRPSYTAQLASGALGFFYVFALRSLLSSPLWHGERGHALDSLINLMFFAPFLGICGLFLLATLTVMSYQTVLSLDAERFVLQRRWLGIFALRHEGDIQALYELAEQPPVPGSQNPVLRYFDGMMLHTDASQRYLLALGLGPAEQAWIQAELQDFLNLDPLPERVSGTSETLPEA